MLIDYVVHTTSEAKQIAGETGVTHEEKNTYLKNRRYYFDAVTKTMVRSMSVLDSGTIDGMATDENGKALILLISDHLDWKNEYDHLLRLQEKINSYITFCEEHQYNEFYEEDLIEYAVFEIHFKYEPTKKAMDFLEQVQRQVNELGITIECHI